MAYLWCVPVVCTTGLGKFKQSLPVLAVVSTLQKNLAGPNY